MSHQEPSRGFIHSLGYKYIQKITANINDASEHPHILSDSQKASLKKVRWETYFLAASIGALAVLIVILPVNLFPNLFGIQRFSLFGSKIEFEVYYTVFGLLMLFPEIWSLNFINLRAVRKICKICNFPCTLEKEYEKQVELLTQAGLEMPAKHLAEFNIDPFLGLSKFSYYSIFIFTKLKATLSNVVAKLLIKRFLGRYALRIFTDLAGIPIFAFWNAWASGKVMKETKTRIMASSATNDFLKTISIEELKMVEPKLGILFHFIAQKKRAYNFALYAYMKSIVTLIPSINLENDIELKLENLFTENVESNVVLAKLLVFGFIVDGDISFKERVVLKELEKEAWYTFKLDEIENSLKSYVHGHGLVGF